MTIDLLPRNALHARWIDNVNEDNESIGLTLRGAMDLTLPTEDNRIVFLDL